VTVSYNQVTVATSGQTAIVSPANASASFSSSQTRRQVTVTNHGGHTVYLGDSAVTSSNGYLLTDGSSVTMVLYAQDGLYGVSSGSSSVVSYIETGV